MRCISRIFIAALTVLAIGVARPAHAQLYPAPDDNSVLILGSTNGIESTIAGLLGYTVVVDSDAAWGARTTADFATFAALILGDQYCGGWYGAADANKTVWSPAVTGNVVVVGTDPSFHSTYYSGQPGGNVVTSSGISFATAELGKTGLYATLSCYYHGAAPFTPVSFLDQFGAFTVTGVGCYNDAHIVAVHPALAGLTDADLSGWGCSVHEAFDSYPPDFLPLAIARNIGCPSPPGTGVNFADGTCGTPYIIARGEELSPIACGNLLLEPPEECDDGNTTNGDGCSAQCTIEVAACGDGTVDPGEGCDDGNTADGDGCSARCTVEPFCGDGTVGRGEECDDGNNLDGDGCSARCTIENEAPVCSSAVPGPSILWPPNHRLVPVTISGVTDADGDAVSITVTSIKQDEPVTGGGQGAGNTSADASLSPLAVRSERNGNPKTPGDGRVYHIAFTATDSAGASCTGVVNVCVPHDQGQGATCVDGGPLFSSIP